MLVLVSLLSSLMVSGCSLSELEDEAGGEEIDQATDEEIEALEQKIQELESEIEEQEKAEEKEVISEEPTIYSFIAVNSPYDGESFFMTDPIEFYGTISEDATKIVVTAYYKEMSFSEEQGLFEQDMVDVYTLQGFEDGDTEFVYRASMSWDNLGHGENTYVFTGYFEDGSQLSDSLTITNEVDGLGKPVIYLYPEETTSIRVNVEPNMGFIYSDPEIGDGWEVVARPNGLLYDIGSKSFYPYLYWEGYSTKFAEYEEGFVVEEGSLKNFFKEKLAILGLNQNEISDFLDFWGPRLENSPYYLITFIDQEELDNLAPLTIEPSPDTVIRVFFDYELLSEPIKIQEQELEPGVREGFTVIEWGGSLF